jgi:hypothetical protein
MPFTGLIVAGVPQVLLGGVFPPSVKLYVPVGFTPITVDATVAVNVTVWPTVAGLGVAASVVVVAAASGVIEVEPVLVTKLASPEYVAV